MITNSSAVVTREMIPGDHNVSRSVDRPEDDRTGTTAIVPGEAVTRLEWCDLDAGSIVALRSVTILQPEIVCHGHHGETEHRVKLVVLLDDLTDLEVASSELGIRVVAIDEPGVVRDVDLAVIENRDDPLGHRLRDDADYRADLEAGRVNSANVGCVRRDGGATSCTFGVSVHAPCDFHLISWCREVLEHPND